VVVLLAVAAAALTAAALLGSTHSSTATRATHTPATTAASALATVTSDNLGQQFTGAFTDTGCGSTDVVADPASTINVTVTADTPSNDLMVNLVYNGTVVHNEDTGVGQETFVYSVSALAGGTYSIQVCESGNPATPLVEPYSYTGVYSNVDVATPALPYPPPGSTTNPITVTPTAKYGNWNAAFSSSTVVDPQRTEGEPLVFVPGDGTIWESGPWGASTNNSFIHRSTNDGKEFHLVADTGLRPDLPPGGGDTDIVVDDQGTVYFSDLEALTQLSTAVSNDNGMNWRKNPVSIQNTPAVDRQWYAVDNGASSSASDNTIFFAFHQTAVGTFIYSSPGSLGPTDPVGGLVWQSTGTLPGGTQPIAADAICAKLHFDPVTRNLYYACDEGNHIRVTVGHVAVGQRTGIQYTNYTAPPTPGGGNVLNLFPTLTTDQAGNVYVAWIDKTNFNLYYAFSTDQGKSWSAPVRVNNSGSATNEFDWAQGGTPGRMTLAWYGTPKVAVGGSDGMPSSLTDLGAATAYPWYGNAALIKGANTAAPQILQARFTQKPMHYGAICNSGTSCATNPSADRQMADFFGFDLAANGGLRVVYDDTTNDDDGAGLFVTRQIAGQTVYGTNLDGKPANDPVTDGTGDAQYPHYSQVGVGSNLPQLDLTGFKVSNPDPATLRFQLSVADLSQLVPPPGKTTPVWLARFQALGPLKTQPQDVYHVYFVYMQKTADAVPQYYAGVTTCQDTTPNNCKVLEYGTDRAVDGSISGNTITIDVPTQTGFGSPIDGNTLYNVTAFTFGRNAVSDLYADVDATEPFDYKLGSVTR
jgi:hypothetical protein